MRCILEHTRLVQMALLLLIFAGCVLPPAAAQQPEKSQAAVEVTFGELADALENEKTRAKLIEQLRALQAAQTATQPAAKAPEPSFARRVALAAQDFASGIAKKVRKAAAAFTAEGESGLVSNFQWSAFVAAATTLLLVAVATVLAYFLLRAAAIPLFGRLGGWALASRRGPAMAVLRRAFAIAVAFAADIVTILVAAAVGYALGLFVFGDTGTIDTRAALFINAFVVIEAFKAVIRVIFASRYDGLRLVSLPKDVADWWSIRFRWLSGLVGYTLLVLIPIINVEIARAAGALIGLVVMVLAYAYAMYMIIGNRKIVGDRIDDRATQASTAFFAVLLRVLGRTWHWLAGGYFTVLLVVSQVATEEALPFMARATLQSGLAIVFGLILSAGLTQAAKRPIRVGERLRRRMPLLETRLNTYVPGILHTARTLILLVVAFVAIDAWQILDLGAWLASDAGEAFLAALIRVGLILLIALGFWTVCASIMDARAQAPSATARTVTLMALFKNALAIVVVVFTLMVVLAQIGVNIGPLLAAAGVLGLAIGFGAQKLVTDVITGVFIQIDNAMNTGDWVTAAGIGGEVERLNIRSVGLRDLSGTYHVVPFSAVSTVSNYNRDFGYHVGEYRIALHEDIDEAIKHLRAAFEDLKADPNSAPYVLEDLMIPGVTELADSSVNIRVMIKATTGMQWAVGRAYNRLVKIHFDAAGIEIPFPHRTMYFGADKKGNARPAQIRMLAADEAQAPAPPSRDKRGSRPADTDVPQQESALDEDGYREDE